MLSLHFCFNACGSALRTIPTGLFFSLQVLRTMLTLLPCPQDWDILVKFV